LESQSFSAGIFFNKIQKANAVRKSVDHRVESENVTIKLTLRYSFIVSNNKYFDNNRANIDL
jgi:hypothetical protein